MAMSKRPSLSLNRNSQAIAKAKPKIRIIHIFAPEIIKTDVSNFRELVQRLTGKPPADKKHGRKMPAAALRHQDTTRSNVIGGLTSDDKPMTVVKEEEERVGVYREETSASGGYLGVFSDTEGFVSEFSQIPSLLPFDDTHHIQGYM